MPILNRLYDSYQTKSGELLEAASSYRPLLREHLCFSKMGLNKFPEPSANGQPTLVSEKEALVQIERYFRDAMGVPFGHMPDFNSRLLLEIADSFPAATYLTTSALQILRESSPWIADLLNRIVPWIIPLEHLRYGRPFRRGVSMMDHLGIIFTSYQERIGQPKGLSAIILAIDLAHEVGHQGLMLFQLADTIMENDLQRAVYSSVRRADRPAILSLHASVASAYMIETCLNIQKQAPNNSITSEFLENSISQLLFHQDKGLVEIRRKVKFTQVGDLIMADLENQLMSCQAKVPAQPADSTNSYFGLLQP